MILYLLHVSVIKQDRGSSRGDIPLRPRHHLAVGQQQVS